MIDKQLAGNQVMGGDAAAPAPDDLRTDDQEYNPEIEPKEARAWLNRLQESEDAFEKYNEHCDKIDRQYANLERLGQIQRDKEFQMFWSNCEVLKPAIYAKPPVPVVVPKFMDRRRVYEAAAETMERCCVVAFDNANIDELMKLVRDDLALLDRGVAWVRYESGKGRKPEKVAIDFKGRRDFLHSLSQNWREVTWVAAASYLTRSEARQRFQKTSGDEYQRAEYAVDKDGQETGGADHRERAKFWEIWDKSAGRVVWVAKGCELILDEDDPEVELRQFFPCPKPAYGTVQRGSLVPVPDVLQYKDQLDEINLLTSRIHALSEALEAKGFYPAGGAEIADAVQAAIAVKTAGRVLVPISNWAAFGGSNEVIIWLPIDMIAQTITALVALRKQVIDDIYQIMGLSDIMRGDTDPNETLGAQNLKSQFGSTRISDKQEEIVRLARDLVEITSEIITERFDPVTIIEMSQTTLPTQQMIREHILSIEQQLEQQHTMLQGAAASPQGQQMAQQNPQGAQAAVAGAQQKMQQGAEMIRKLWAEPTIEQVLTFLRDNRTKAFVLDIETDSTIIPNEAAEKQSRNEFVGVLAQLLPQLSQMISADPQTADFCGALLKFAVAPYRAGRSLDGPINELVALMEQKGDQPKGTDPATAQTQAAMQIEQMKLTYQKQRDDADRQLKSTQIQMEDARQRAQINSQAVETQQEVMGRQQEHDAKLQQINQQAINQQQDHQAKMQQQAFDAAMDIRKHNAAMQAQAAQQSMRDQQAQDRRAAMQFRMQQPRPLS